MANKGELQDDLFFQEDPNLLSGLEKRAKHGPSPAEPHLPSSMNNMDTQPNQGVLTRQRSLKMTKEESTTSMYAMFNNQAKQGAVGSNNT